MTKKFILFCFIFSFISCKKVLIEPKLPNETKDIFTIKEIIVENGKSLNFNLKSSGDYTLTLFDTVSQQVLTKEKIKGKIGENTINIYTKTLPIRYLYLSLEDENNNQIGKTLLVIN